MANDPEKEVVLFPQFVLQASELIIPSVELYSSHLLTRELDDIEQAVRCAQIVFELAPRSSRANVLVRWQLARSLLRRFQCTMRAEDVNQAITLFRSFILRLRDPQRRQSFGYLRIAFFERDNNLDGFNEFLALNAPDVQSQSESSLETTIHKLESDEVFYYFIQKHPLPVPPVSSKDVDSEVQITRQALGFFSSNPQADKLEPILRHLANLLYVRFSPTGQIDDLNEAIECSCLALNLASPTSETFKQGLLVVSNYYGIRHLLLGRQNDLDDAFRFCKLALDVFDSQDPKFVDVLTLHSSQLRQRYDITGDVKDLDAAIEYTSRAIDRGVRDDILLYTMTSLAGYLSIRGLRSGRAEDLSEATAIAQKVVDLFPPKHPKLAIYLTYLGNYKLEQFDMLMDTKYQQRGLQHIREAQAISKEDPGLIHSIGDAGLDLIWAESMIQFDDGSLGAEALDTVIATLRDGRLHFHMGSVSAQVCLGSALRKRWLRAQKKEDLNEAISLMHNVIEVGEIYPESSVRARLLLGELLQDRYHDTGDDEDCQKALVLSMEAFRMSAGRPNNRIGAGFLAVQLLSELGDFDGAYELSREILELYVIVNARSLGWQDKQFCLRKFPNIAAGFTSIGLEAGRNVLDVIDMLEAFRGSILGHLIDKHTDIDGLEKVAPEKALLFKTLQNEISAEFKFSSNTNSRVTHTTRRIQAEGEIRDCLADIRKLEGFHKFLLGPTQEELKGVAVRGPIVVVNTTHNRSDAILITKDDLVVLRLPSLKYEVVKEYVDADLTNFCLDNIGNKNKKYRRLQRWLWDNCVKPILNKLDDLDACATKRHIWWIGVDLASSLPFHAAGIYTESKNNTETALSRAISSYAPTLKVLINCQRKVRSYSPKQDGQSLARKLEASNFKPRLAVITMPSTPGLQDLEGVELEARELQKIVGDTFSTQILVQPSAEIAMAHMEDCEVVHFACHGESTLPDMSSSHLMLQTTSPDSTTPVPDKLTLRDVAASNVSVGKLAFLSACSTAQNRFAGGRFHSLPDEALHLASGFQVSGYLHAVGNLWPADDDVSAQLVTSFYKHLVAAGDLGDGENVAEALNEAVGEVARHYPLQPLCWAQYVHFGV